jgi:tRNA U34 5-methylaminomethyl-2-thiouridine-forming methyltransferase MnmC
VTQFFSQKYNDIYFNQADPEAEKQFVFIEANNIAERIIAAESFTVAELGFGFGLNFALTLHAAKKADCLRKLSYFSVEENFPEQTAVTALAERLKICREEYTPPPGPLSTWWGGVAEGRGGVSHTDVLTFLTEARFLADAWYFDGFSPAKNPAMWSAEVFARTFALTRPGGTFSTYSAAGWVKRNLEAAGFAVKKVPGFGSKREMLIGHRPSAGEQQLEIPSGAADRK